MGFFQRFRLGGTDPAIDQEDRPRAVGRPLYTVDELIQVLGAPDFGLPRLRRVAIEGDLLAWLEARLWSEAALVAKIQALFRRQGANTPVLLFGLRYTLTPTAPLELAPGQGVRDPADLAPLLTGERAAREAALRSLREMIADGRLAEWLRAIEVARWQQTLEGLDAVRLRQPQDQDLPCWLLIWSYAPDSPFPFGDRLIPTPSDLARAIDASESSRREGLALFERDWIRIWLVSTGQLGQTSTWDAVAGDTRAPPLVRLELVLRLLDPERPVPCLVAKPSVLDFGLVRQGSTRQRRLRIDNAQGGCIAGSLELEDGRSGILLSAVDFDSTPATLTVTVDATGLTAGASRETRIQVRAVGGEAEVPVRYRVGIPYRTLFRRLGVGSVVVLVAAIWWTGVQRTDERVPSRAEPPPSAIVPPQAPRSQPNPPRDRVREPLVAVTQPQMLPEFADAPPEIERRPPRTPPGAVPPDKPPDVPDALSTARRLMDQGRLGEALGAAEKGLVAQPKSKGLNVLRAELQGRAHEASLRPDERERIQRALTLLGFDTKGVDGGFGPNTRAAIRRFQGASQAPETGWLTDAQLAALMTRAEPVLRDWEKRQRPPGPPWDQDSPRNPTRQPSLPPGKVLCTGPGGSQVMDAMACKRIKSLHGR